MKKQRSGEIVYSPSDLVRYVASPFASWMDRYHLENPGAVTPNEVTDDAKLIAQTGPAGAILAKFGVRSCNRTFGESKRVASPF